MDDMRLKFYTPVVTGKPRLEQAANTGSVSETQAEQQDFSQILAETIRKNSEVNFSKHAVKRAVEHNIELTDESLSRLNRGVKIASEKNLEEPLILVGNTAFLVNIPNNTVITAIDSGNMKENVFTNIDGTVII